MHTSKVITSPFPFPLYNLKETKNHLNGDILKWVDKDTPRIHRLLMKIPFPGMDYLPTISLRGPPK